MTTAAKTLRRHASCLFGKSNEHAQQHRLEHPALALLYEDFNGGYFWGRALVIRPPISLPDAPASIAEWNHPGLWSDLYDDICRDTTFFAEDAFGAPVGIRADRVVGFDPETASFTDLADNIDDWMDLLVGDAAYHTGAPVLNAWESAHGPIPSRRRLIPKQPFMLGGEFSSSNMVCKVDVEGMKIRAQLWRLTKDIPDGQQIVFNVDE